jgi:hypothetical protein
LSTAKVVLFAMMVWLSAYRGDMRGQSSFVTSITSVKWTKKYQDQKESADGETRT